MPVKLLTILAALGSAPSRSHSRLGVTSAQSNVVTNGKHFFLSQDQSTPTPDQLASDIIYHGGNAGPGAVGVLTEAVCLHHLWGTEWQQGFKTPDTDGTLFSSKTLQTYLELVHAGRRRQLVPPVQTQYCRGILAGSTTCAGDPLAENITNPKIQLQGHLDRSVSRP